MDKKMKLILGAFGGILVVHDILIAKLIMAHNANAETVNRHHAILDGLFQERVDEQFNDIAQNYEE